MKNGLKYKPWNGKVIISIEHYVTKRGNSSIGVYALTRCRRGSKKMHTQPLAYVKAKLMGIKLLKLGKGNE